MNKGDLIKAIPVIRPEQTEVCRVSSSMMRSISLALKGGDNITLSGLALFRVTTESTEWPEPSNG